MSNLSDLFSGGGAKPIRTDTITASGVYTRPAEIADDDLVIVDMWGGGASGNRQASGDARGTRPGSWVRLRFRAEEMGATTAIEIGAGGIPPATDGNGSVGGSTKFGRYAAIGGRRFTGAPELLVDVDLNSIMDLYPTNVSGAAVQTPLVLKPPVIAFEFPFSFNSSDLSMGGGNGNSNAIPANFRGGWGGMAIAGAAEPYSIGQTSIWGGKGGEGQSLGKVATAGAPRGGGGGSSLTGSPAGAGGRGEVMIRYYRGVPR